MVLTCLKGEKSTAVSFGSLPLTCAMVMAVRLVASGRSPEAVMVMALGGGGEKEGCWASAPMSAYERGVKRGLEVWSNVQELKERGRSVTVVSEGKSDGEGKGKRELSSTTEKQ